MRKVRTGQTFLYRKDGYNSTVIEVQLKKNVNGAALQEALRQTSERYPYLKEKLVEKNGNYYLCKDENSMIAAPTDKFRRLGSMSTGYHLLDVTYHKDLIRIAFHHALCDGRGVKPFVETLLYYYAGVSEQKEYLSKGIRIVGNSIDEKEYEEPIGTEYFQVREVECSEPVRGFRLSESNTADQPCYKTDFVLDEAVFVKKAKEIGATPAIMLMLLVSDAIEKCNPDHPDRIVCHMAMDLRDAIGKELTHCNCVGSVPLVYEKTDWSILTKTYRSLLQKQREENHVKGTLNKQIGLFNKLDERSSMEEKKQMMSIFDQMISDTFVISYLGRLQLNDYSDLIERVSFYNDSIGGMTINMISAAGKMTVTMLQSFSDLRYIQNLQQTFQAYGLLSVTETRKVVTGKDKSHITAGHQGERFFIR